MKEHDYFLELMSNPTFSPKDFQLVGLDSSNTELLSKDKYKNSQTVQNCDLFQTNGQFDENKLDLAYEQALLQYNELCTLSEAEKPFFRNDLFAPSSLKQKGPEYKIEKVMNPLRLQRGFVTFGVEEAPKRSYREVAEANIQYDYKTGKWLKSPNERWWDNFFNPKVLALWDFDADKNGNPTNDPNKIVYHKGEKKIDPVTGTFYYESLGGRSIYGREVLSGFDTLTVDGSKWNKYDFFDSDDIEKSTFGTLSRTAAQILPVFIPYVNTAYLSTRIGISLAEIMPTIGKIFLGSDNELLSAIEGWNKAFSFSTSDAAQADPWTAETGLKLVADVFTQLAEQRFIFKYGNAAFSKVNPTLIEEGEKGAKARQLYIESLAAKEGFNLNALRKAKTLEELELIAKSEEGIKFARAEALLNQRLKAGLDIARNMSLAYMTGVTTASSYGEAKKLGASDLEAALFALGYSFGEWKLLNSDIGKWILPELKLEKFEMQSVAESLRAITDKTVGDVGNKVSKETLKTLLLRFFNFGKLFAKLNYSDKVLTSTGKMTMASALAEGTEEVSEELLLDFSKTIFNLANTLRNDDTRFTDAWENMSTRYTMSFLGGTMGGGISTLLPGYRAARQRQREIIESKSKPNANTLAYKKLVNYALNDKIGDYKETVLKMNFADTELSDEVVINSDNTKSYAPAASYEDSLDYKIKLYLLLLADMVVDLLNSHGRDFKLTNDELLDELTLKQLKFYSLLNSTTLGIYTNDYSNHMARLVDIAAKVNTLEHRKEGIPENPSDPALREAKKEKENWTQADEETLKTYKKELKDIKDHLLKYKDGTMAREFLGKALFEMSIPLSSTYGITLINWMEEVEGKKYDEISKERKNELIKLWEEGDIARREIINKGYQIFLENQLRFNELLRKYEETYFTDKEENIIRNLEEIFLGNTGREVALSKSDAIVPFTEGYMVDALRVSKKAPFGFNLDILDTLLKGIEGKVDLATYNNYSERITSFKLSLEDYFGFKLPLTIEEYKKLTPELTLKLLDYYYTDIPENVRPSTINSEEELQTITSKIETIFNNEKFQGLDDFTSLFLLNKTVLDELLNIIKNTKYITPATKAYLKNFFSSANVSDKKIIDTFNKAVDNINSSPLEELLNQMVYSLTEAGFDTTGMTTDLAQLLNDLANGLNLGEFSYSEEIDNKINKTLLLINMAQAHIQAAKTEVYGTVGDTFGYNATMNELSEKYPIEGAEKELQEKTEKLPELKVDTANSMLHELAKLRNNLLFYKHLFDANSSATLTEHKKLEIKLYKIYYNNILKLSTDIPDDWDKTELNKALNSATNLQNLSEDLNLTLDERIAIFTEKLNIEKAIYELFQKNNLNTFELFKLIFKKFLEIEEEKTSVIDVNVTKLDNIDFIWYIASLSAVNPEAIYNEYLEAITESEFIPVIGQEEVIRRAYAYLINPNIFSKFKDLLNQVVEELVKEKNKISGLDVSNYVLSNRYFLIEGNPGTGKTTAVYSIILKMLTNNHPELLKNVWFISNSEENAKNTIVDLGLPNALALSKELYFKLIADNYQLTFNSTGEIVIHENEVIKDDKGIFHYKNETLKDVKSPTLVLFDEGTSLSLLDLLLSHKFLDKHNLFSLIAGDFGQLGALGWLLSNTEENGKYPHFNDVDGASIYLGLGNANFISSWKLGTSMRSNNSYKSGNISKVNAARTKLLENIKDILKNFPIVPITFSYYENPSQGLYGDKVETDIEKAKETIIHMLDTMSDDIEVENENGEKVLIPNQINFITDNLEGELYSVIKELMDSEKYKNKFKIISAGASQGLEGLYYIIDLQNTYKQAQTILSNDEENITVAENFIKAFYTAISRAKQASLVFGHYGPDSDESITLFNSIPLSKLLISSVSETTKTVFSKERLNIINSGLTVKDATTPKIEWLQPKLSEESVEELPLDEEVITKEKVQESNITPIKRIENKEQGKLNLLIHTFMCNETGCKVIDKEGNINLTMDPLDPDAILQLGDFHEDRIDNIHGLVKLFLNSGIKLPFETRDYKGNLTHGIKVGEDGRLIEIAGGEKAELITLLNSLREVARNYDDRAEIISKILDLLGTDLDLGINFIYHQHYEDYNSPEVTKEEFESGKFKNYRKHYKGKEENLSGIINDDNTNEEIHLPRNGVISILITLANNKLLIEIPLAKITSPLTLLALDEFKEIKLIYTDSKGNLTEFKKRIKKALIEAKEIPHLYEFALALEVYLATAFNNVAYLDKIIPGFTLAGYASPTGITITNKPKGEEYVQSDKYYYNGKWVTLSKYKDLLPWRNISRIMVSANLEAVTLNERQILPGKPFVLVSDVLTNLDSEGLLNLYIKLLNGSSEKQLVKLVYVVPPSVETEKYLFNLYTAFNIHKDKNVSIDKDLGTKNTAFRLLSQIFDKEDFLNIYKSFLDLNKSTKQAHLDELEALKILTKSLLEFEKDKGRHELYNLLNMPIAELKTKLDSSIKKVLDLLRYKSEGLLKFLLSDKNNLTLRHLYLRELYNILYSSLLPGNVEVKVTKDNDRILYNNKEIEDRVKAFLADVDWKEVLLHVKIKYSGNPDPIIINDETTLNVAYVETDYGDEYAIGNKEYLINGKIDSTLYTLDIIPMLKWILTGAIGRDPEKIDTNMDHKNIFEITEEALKNINNTRYMSNSSSISEEDKVAKKKLKEDESNFSDLLPTRFVKGLGNKKDLIKNFLTLKEEERTKILEDPRQFIYLNLGILSRKLETGKYKFYVSNESKNSENPIFNSNGTITFTYNGQEYILDENDIHLVNVNPEPSETLEPVLQLPSEIQSILHLLLILIDPNSPNKNIDIFLPEIDGKRNPNYELFAVIADLKAQNVRQAAKVGINKFQNSTSEDWKAYIKETFGDFETNEFVKSVKDYIDNFKSTNDNNCSIPF